MEKLTPEQIASFQKMILVWYAKNQRDLPWRKTRDAYHILVSEIMLQKTQVSRVIPKYTAWIEAFPTVAVLASAPVPKILTYWSGLGYNRRALNLRKTAQVITEQYAGKFPQTEHELLALPGIGRYTSKALLCFAFDKQVAVVDTNVRKVILTQVLKQSAMQLTEKELEDIATKLLPLGKAYEWNQALMDYASSVLKKEKIPVQKQSKFIGSHRYYRGQVLKLLLTKHTLAIHELGELIKKDFTFDEQPWLMKLLIELQDEGFVLIRNNEVELAN